MKHLKELKIKGFQSHADTHMSFSPYLNVIVGESDQGKSAVIRGVKWLAFNRPIGDEFRSNFDPTGETSVWAKFDEGEGKPPTVVERLRSGKRKTGNNLYVLNGEEFRAFGDKVPKEVGKALGLADLNFSHQLDAPFLLSNTPGEIAKTLRGNAGLEDADIILRGIKIEAAKNKKELVRSGAELAERQAELGALPDPEMVGDLLAAAEGANEDLVECRRRRLDLSRLAEGIRESREELASYSGLPQAELSMAAAQEKWKEAGEVGGQVSRLRGLVGSITSGHRGLESLAGVDRGSETLNAVERRGPKLTGVRRRLASLRDALTSLRGLRLESKQVEVVLVADQPLRGVENTWVMLQGARSSKAKLTVAMDAVADARADLGEATGHHEALNSELKSILPKVCPTCGQPWPKGKGKGV